MAGKTFEKKKLNENDYKGDEKKVKTGKKLLGAGVGLFGVVVTVIKLFTGHGSSSSKV